MLYNNMAEIKDLDQRFNTKGAGTIRIETSVDVKTGLVTKCSLAYVNLNIHSSDNGRVVGFDNSHVYPGFLTEHHGHWFGGVFENKGFVSFEETKERFQRFLQRLKYVYGKNY